VLCLVGCAVATGVGAVMNSAQVPAGARLAVIGCGGVGLNIIQGARLAGADRIVAVDLQRHKLELAEQLGATDVVVASDDTVGDLVRLIPGGVDFCFDAIGLPVTTEQAIASLALGGSAVIVGIPPAGQFARLDAQTLVDRDQRVLGSNYGGIKPSRDIPQLVDRFMNGEVQLEPLVSGRLGLDDAETALSELGSGSALRQLLIP
jgi:S-(hydroxymethyl)glutathione dehydrogenase/alcohol dehydrogenase